MDRLSFLGCLGRHAQDRWRGFVVTWDVDVNVKTARGVLTHAVHIIDGRVPHALLLEVLGDQPFGTMIRG